MIFKHLLSINSVAELHYKYSDFDRLVNSAIFIESMILFNSCPRKRSKLQVNLVNIKDQFIKCRN